MTKSMHAISTTVLLAALVLGGCGQPDETTATDEPTEGAMSSSSPSSVPGAGTPPARAAAADLATRLGVDEDEVAVTAVEAVTWRDGSLGCAEPGTMYTQALVEGQRITLAVGEEEYEYHAGGSRDAFLCEDPTQ